VQEFWRRWHMSLSSWLRDYLYISLGGNQGTRLFTYRNLLLTMLLGGLWHGANMTFVVWGALHGVALIAHRAWRELLTRRAAAAGHPVRSPFDGAVGEALAWASTLAWVVACFAIFRAATLHEAFVLFGRFDDWRGAARLSPDWWLLLLAAGAAHLLLFRRGRAILARLRSSPDTAFYFAYGVCWALVPYFMPVNAQPFIYFQF